MILRMMFISITQVEFGSTLFRRYHTPGISLYRTLIAYSLYPFNSSCNVWSSHWVRTINTSEARPAGINAHKEPNDSAMPIAWIIPPT
ncbi:MAG: hypothetical protein ACKVH8_19435 [Pirellulales bacterium]